MKMTEWFRSCLICIMEWSCPFGGLTSGWQEYDVSAIPSLDGVFISEHTGICPPSEVKISVAELNWIERR